MFLTINPKPTLWVETGEPRENPKCSAVSTTEPPKPCRCREVETDKHNKCAERIFGHLMGIEHATYQIN